MLLALSVGPRDSYRYRNCPKNALGDKHRDRTGKAPNSYKERTLV